MAMVMIAATRVVIVRGEMSLQKTKNVFKNGRLVWDKLEWDQQCWRYYATRKQHKR